jgi:PKD repeat protein
VLYYLVGSDLETKGGDGTADLKEVIEAYKGADPGKLDLIVAFGGSKKAGWQGMKIVTGAQLIEDGKDGKFGNGRNYLYSNTSADMGLGWCYQKFITVAKDKRTADRTVLIISDHGGSYGGIGQDERTLELLQMNDIDLALSKGEIQSDPFVFDACLMSSVEVAKTVQPYTTLMLGSENFAYGSYNYSKVIGPLVSKPGTASEEYLKGIASDYLSEGTNIKTMSIINTSKVPALQESLGKLGTELVSVSEDKEGLHDLKGAYNNAIKVGVTNGKATAVDLVSLLKNIKQKRPELATEVDAAIALAKSAVIYEEHNKYSKAVSGISIASPDAMDLKEYNKYGQGVKIDTDWDTVFVKLITESQGTGSDSAKSGEGMGPFISGSNEVSGEDTTATLSKPGFTGFGNGEFELLDPYQDASVYGAYYRIDGPYALEIGTQPILPGSNGRYQLPQWDGRWYYIPGDAVDAQPLLLDMVYDGVTEGGYSTYYSWVSMDNDGYHNEATLATFADQSTGPYAMMITPYTITDEGAEIFGRSMDQFESGARVSSYSEGFTKDGLETGDQLLSHTTATPGMAMQYTMLPDGTYACGVMAYYDDDSEVLADEYRIITIRNGVLVNSTIGPLRAAWGEEKPPFLADFMVSPLSGMAPLTVKCSDKSIGNPTRYHYDFGDGTSTTGPNPEHTYRLPGTYNITLTITKFDQASGFMLTSTTTKENVVTITGGPSLHLVAGFSAGPVQGTAPLKVHFTDQSTGNPTFCNYDFGDGVNMTRRNPDHIYRNPGTYTVTLTVTKYDAANGSMASDSAIKTDLIVVKSI